MILLFTLLILCGALILGPGLLTSIASSSKMGRILGF